MTFKNTKEALESLKRPDGKFRKKAKVLKNKYIERIKRQAKKKNNFVANIQHDDEKRIKKNLKYLLDKELIK